MNSILLIILLIIIALLVSILGSISGVGGGVLFVPVMLMLLPYSFNEIRFVSTLLVFSSASINVGLEIIKKRFNYILISVILITAIPTVFLGSYLASLIDPKLSKIIVIVILSIVTILLSFSDLIKKKVANWKKAKRQQQSWYILQTKYGLSINLFKVVVITFLGGIITALTGMGGGPILMPMLLLLCGLGMKQATPISHTVIAITSFLTLCFNYQYFSHQTLNLQVSLPMICGVVVGTLIAYFIKNKITNEAIIKWILIVLIWVSIVKMIIDVAT